MRISYLFILAVILSCNRSDKAHKDEHNNDVLVTTLPKNVVDLPDTTNQHIYDFMKIVIKDQNLDLNYGLTIDPEPGCDLSGNDEAFLKTLLIVPSKNNEAGTTNGDNITFSAAPDKCLTNSDIQFMLEQKKIFASFKWDNLRMGFNLANDKNWYCFSIPLFSKDRKKAVMMIRDLCQGLCGTGSTVLFIKEDNKWSSQTAGRWVH